MRPPAHIRASLLLFLLLCGLQARIQAQNTYYPTYNTPGTDSTRAFLDSAKFSNSPSTALAFLNKALEAAIVSRNKNGEAEAYLLMAGIQRNLNRAGDAEASLIKCKSLFFAASETNSVLNTVDLGVSNSTTTGSSYGANRNIPLAKDRNILLRAGIQLAQLHEAQNQFQQALAETEQALQLLKGMPGKPKQAEVQLRQARLWSKLGRRQEAYDQFQELIEAARKSKDKEAECQGMIALAEHQQLQGENAKAQVLLESAVALAQTHGLKETQIQAGQALAALFKAMGNLDSELDARNDVVGIGAIDAAVAFDQNLAIGNAYLADDQLDLAAQFLQNGVAQLKVRDVKPAVGVRLSSPLPFSQPPSTNLQAGADAYLQLAEGYGRKRELEKSLEYYKKYAVLQDSAKQAHAREMEAAIALSKSLGKNEERVQLLERERTLSDVSIELLKQDQEAKSAQIFTRNLIIGVLIGCLALALVGGLVLVKNTRARRRADKLLALQSMTGQMNPHFIFNALNSVNEYISQNDERAANRYLTAFSRLMRKVMDDSKHTFIPLSEEVDMLRLYLELEHARFKDQFVYTFEVDEALENAEFELPPMIVQPYIENAIWHGLRYRPGGGKLHIHFQRQEALLHIVIADDGIGIAQSKALKTTHQKRQHSMGMKNIGTRMALMNEIYQSGMQVSFSETHPDAEFPGTTVRISIPQNRSPKTRNPA